MKNYLSNLKLKIRKVLSCDNVKTTKHKNSLCIINENRIQTVTFSGCTPKLMKPRFEITPTENSQFSSLLRFLCGPNFPHPTVYIIFYNPKMTGERDTRVRMICRQIRYTELGTVKNVSDSLLLHA